MVMVMMMMLMMLMMLMMPRLSRYSLKCFHAYGVDKSPLRHRPYH